MTKEKQRIMHIVHSLNEGGIERLLLEMCLKLNKNKFNIQICCLVERGSIVSEFEKIGIRVHLINARRDFKLKNILPNTAALFRVIKLLRAEGIDITHGHEFFSTVFSRLAAIPARVKKRFITLHNVYYWWGPAIHKAQHFLSFFTTKVVCVSKAAMTYSLKHDKIDKEKYLLIYNGIDCVKFSPRSIDNKKLFLEEYNLANDQLICMSVGSISPRKNFTCLVKAANILRSKFPQIIYFIVGDKHYQEDFEYENIQGLIRDFKLEDRVIISGNRSDVNEILNFCDLYVMPSYVEGFGLALVEAMAVERVCVASDIEPFKEIVDNGKDGFLFESGNEHNLAEKIEEVLSMDKKCLKEVGSNARMKVIAKFSSQEMIRQYENLYEA